MTSRKLALLTIPIAALLAVVAACGDDDNGGSDGGTGQLTDPRSVPTATPWSEAPDPIILDPDNLTPISGGSGVGAPDGDGNGDGDGGDGDGDNGDGDGDGDSEGPPPGECGGDTYTIEPGDNFFLIAEKCGLDPADIEAANPGVDPGALSIGQVINLPAADSGGDEEE